MLIILRRDGDTVVIRASADGEDSDLIIKDNHPLGTYPHSKSAISEVATLDLQ
jgi:hypothetical protein